MEIALLLVVGFLVLKSGALGGGMVTDVKMAGNNAGSPLFNPNGAPSLASDISALACAAGGAYAGGPAGAKVGAAVAPVCASFGAKIAEVAPKAIAQTPKFFTQPTTTAKNVSNIGKNIAHMLGF